MAFWARSQEEHGPDGRHQVVGALLDCVGVEIAGEETLLGQAGAVALEPLDLGCICPVHELLVAGARSVPRAADDARSPIHLRVF